MAVGGEGAPLAPYGDMILFRHHTKGRILQNIGGIGNCSVIVPHANVESVLAFDTGPGNMIMDQAVYLLSDGAMTYDAEGAWAAQGSADDQLVDELLEHPYFRLAPPKSTGRELFGKAYAAEFVSKA